MSDIAPTILIRVSAVMAILVVLAASAWIILKKRGYLRLDQPFNAADLKTWPLSLVVLDAAIYGAIFVGFQAAFGDNLVVVAIAAAVATVIGLSVVPKLMARIRK